MGCGWAWVLRAVGCGLWAVGYRGDVGAGSVQGRRSPAAARGLTSGQWPGLVGAEGAVHVALGDDGGGSRSH